MPDFKDKLEMQANRDLQSNNQGKDLCTRFINGKNAKIPSKKHCTKPFLDSWGTQGKENG